MVRGIQSKKIHLDQRDISVTFIYLANVAGVIAERIPTLPRL
jgi:hypothetical protein